VCSSRSPAARLPGGRYDPVAVADPITYGEIPGIPVGATFRDRRALREAGLHRPLQAGIDFTSGQAAASVVLSGVYPDEDQGCLCE
jgi:hypothetical protein